MGAWFHRWNVLPRSARSVGVIWASPEDYVAAAYTSANSPQAQPCKGKRLHIGILTDAVDEPTLDAWSARQGAKRERVIPRASLFASVIKRYTTDKTALLIGSIKGNYFLGLIKEHVCVFDFSSTGGSAELEKALKHCMRLHRGKLPAYIAADSGLDEQSISDIVFRTVGAQGVSLKWSAGPLLASAAAPPPEGATYSFRHVAAATLSATLLGSLLFLDYSMRERLHQSRERLEMLRSEHASLMTRARELESHVSDRAMTDNPDRGSSTEALMLLQHMGRHLPSSAMIERLSIGEVRGTTAPYSGIRAPAPNSTASLIGITGVAQDLSDLSRFLDSFSNTAWRVSKVENIAATDNDSGLATGAYHFRVDLRQAGTS